MKLRLTLELPDVGMHDIVLACDSTASVGDTARTLIRAGVTGDRQLEEIAAHRLAPVTLLGSPGDGTGRVLLDPGSPIASSGLQAGWTIRAVAEFAGHDAGTRRLVDVAGYVEVLSGKHAGATFSLTQGMNLIGRDRDCRISLSDSSVSRRHVLVEVGAVDQPAGATTSDSDVFTASSIVLRDLGSVNGLIVDRSSVSEYRVVTPCTVTLGDIDIRVIPGPPPAQPIGYSHRVLHTRAPRIDPRFPASERALPAPPTPATPGRIPMLAMLAPMMMGGAMYAITQSPMSLMMVAFSPMMMIGSWLDGRLGGRRKLRRELAQFVEILDAERTELTELRSREITMRAGETPSVPEVIDTISTRGSLLWARRPEHRSFLEVRLGAGVLRSRTTLCLPARGEAPREQWEALRSIEREFRDIEPVPVLERFARCGGIGVAGEPVWAEGTARALVLQLVGLHSPAELVLACFAGPQHAEEWNWLKWLPHIDTVSSPIPVWQIGGDTASSSSLLTALEGLILARSHSRATRGSIRSHLDRDTRNDDEHGEAIRDLPITPIVVVLVLDDGLVDRSRLIAIAEDGPDVGVHVLWVTDDRASLPGACRTFVDIDRAEAQVGFVRSGTVVTLQSAEWIDTSHALAAARVLAPVEDTSARALDESDLPRMVNLRELHATDLLGGAQPVLQAWSASDTLTAGWTPGTERVPSDFAAVVGQGPDGPASVDLRSQGPHALVGGTTGAGKSEFLQSWIMSLAARISPERLTFLMVDYKGGAAFAECVDLPHTVGLVTDLSPHLVRRALTSLRAELHYREELLAVHGAKDLIAMERRSDTAAPPALVIVIDEFAALASDVPEFVDGVIDIAQRGRSLGLHLIMATQRPAGVISDNLRANTNLRIALRMADEHDSVDVIGVNDAAFFDAATPGRGAIKIGPGRIAHFQSAYLGERATAAAPETHIEVRSLDFCEGEPWDIPPEPVSLRQTRSADAPGSGVRTGARDIERLRDGIIAAAQHAGLAPPRRPWLDELPQCIDLAVLRVTAHSPSPARRGAGGAERVARDAPVIGLLDDPAAQRQNPVVVDFDEVGNIAIIGAGGTGKTSALFTLAGALSMDAERWPVQLYAIDAAGGALDAIRPLPTVGAVAPLADSELVGRVLRRMLELIAERGPRYAAARAGNLGALRRISGYEQEPRVVLLIDGFSAFRQATEGIGGTKAPLQLLSEIMMTGRAVGVHVVLTGDRPSAIPAAMSSALQQQYVLRLANVHDYGYLSVASDVLATAGPGRALAAGDGREIQFALLGGCLELAAQAAELEQLATKLRERGVTPAPEIVTAPERIDLASLNPDTAGRPVYGIDTDDFTPIGLPLTGLGVIAGPAGSGQSTALLTCFDAVVRWAETRGEKVEGIVLSLVDNGLASVRPWRARATGDAEVASLTARLVEALGGRPAAAQGMLGGSIVQRIGTQTGVVQAGAGTDAEPECGAERLIFPSPGARGVVLIERPAEAEGSDALPQLVALARAARRSGVLVLFEFEQGTGSGMWDLFSVLKQSTWGLALQPDAAETQSPLRASFGRVTRADFPPGRGFAVESGRIRPVHVALPGR